MAFADFQCSSFNHFSSASLNAKGLLSNTFDLKGSVGSVVGSSHIDLPFDGAEEKPDELPGSPDGLDMDLQDCAIVGVVVLWIEMGH